MIAIKKKRPQGAGTVYFASGKWIAQLPNSYDRGVVGRFETEEEARRVLAAALMQLAQGPAPQPKCDTLQTYGAKWLEARQHMRSYPTQRALWSKHIHNSDIAHIALPDISRIRLKQWIGSLTSKKCHKSEKRISHQTKVHLVNLVRRCLHEAFEDGLIRNNPAIRLEIQSPVDASPGWQYLEPEQQSALLAACRGPEKHIVEVALFTGCRKSELWTLHLNDVHLDDDEPWIWVQYGGRKRGQLQPPKNGRPRRVPLTPAAKTALQQWLQQLPQYTASKQKDHGNPHSLVFPGRFGEYRDKSRQPRCWAAALKQTKLTLRWHDLRHTCASSLVAGWWGRAWSLQEVREFLGHSSIKITERYAHLSGGVLAKAAAATVVATRLPQAIVSASPVSHDPLEILCREDWIRTSDFLLPKQARIPYSTITYDALLQLCGNVAQACLNLVRVGESAHHEGRALCWLIRGCIELKILTRDFDETTSKILGNDTHKRALIVALAERVVKRSATNSAGLEVAS